MIKNQSTQKIKLGLKGVVLGRLLWKKQNHGIKAKHEICEKGN